MILRTEPAAPAGRAEPSVTTAGHMPGFGNHFASEAVAGALPVGRNSPQRAPFGLYAEQLSGTAFTAPRALNRRSWLYRLRPTACHSAYRRCDFQTLLTTGPFTETAPSPNRLRWDPPPLTGQHVDFIHGLTTYAGNGDVAAGTGIGIHLYVATASMGKRAFCNADGEMLIVPERGRLRIVTEFGTLTIEPLQIALIPRGVRFKVELLDAVARGYVCENYGEGFRLPELGPIGSNGLANARDFETPVAGFEDVDGEFEIILKFQGGLWTTPLDHSPFDVVAWHGNLAPCRYDLRRFNAINSVSFDHPDPSIFTVLTSPGTLPGTADCDFVIFPPRWIVAEDTFRPPWFHRNVMSEFMGLIQGEYDAKDGGFLAGGASLHNQMSAHGPDRSSYEKAVRAALEPQRVADVMAFMFESRSVIRPTAYAMQSPTLQPQYDACWSDFQKANLVPARD